MTDIAAPSSKPLTRGGKTVRRVLDASRDLMSEGGFEAVQLAAVSKRSGVSTGSLYHHFGSKAGIITRLVDEFTAKAVADLNKLDLAGCSFDARLKSLLDLTCVQFRGNPALYQSMAQRVQADPAVWQPLRTLRASFEGRMIRELSDGLTERGVRDPERAIHRMVQTVLGVLTHSVLFDSGPVRPTDAGLETQIFAIGRAVLLLPDKQEPFHDE